MSFNIDDPLAGILSDGSDDSFFDDDILGKKKPPKKKTTPIAEKKNALFNLGDGDKPKQISLSDKKDSPFDFGDPAAKKSVPALDDLPPPKVDIPKSPAPFRRTVSKESIKFVADSKNNTTLDKFDSIAKSPVKTKTSSSVDKLNILDDLLEPKKDSGKALEKGKSSQSLLDDILGPPKTAAGSNQTTRPATAAKSQDFDLDSFIGKSESKQSVTTSKEPIKNAPPKQTIKTDYSKENTMKKSKPGDDWLGIFQNKDIANEEEEEDDTGMPAWLIGDKKKKADTKKVREPPAVKEQQEEQEIQERVAPQVDTNEQIKLAAAISSLPVFTAAPPMPIVPKLAQGSNEDITTEGATLFMEQQESQLMLALQLKAQEEKLAAMQTRQKETQRIQREATQAQHAQVDAILQRQAAQRQQMQAIIAAHQERITQRIKNLLGSSNMVNDDTNEYVDTNADGFEQVYSQMPERREGPQMTEKKQLLQLVQSLQENHDKEIDLMETSYRRQLAFLEVSVNQSEERMKEESGKVVKYYTEKINWLEEHHHLFRRLTEENTNAMTERHKIENEMLRQQHLENIKILQEHHATLMENIKNAVKQEQVLIRDSAGFSADLVELVSDVKESKYQCQQLVEKVQAIADNTKVETERSLQVRETHINDMIQQLKKERENFETEKTESRDMVKMLEGRLKQMTMMMEEETASLKQKRMEFEFEKATFSKQTEFAKNVLKKQDEEIKMLRDDIQREYKEKISKIDEERAKSLKDAAVIAKEKASIQNLKQELEKTKAELQAQLEEVSEERSKLNLEKQQIHMEEQRILAKARDLDLLAKTAIEKQTQADKKYAEAEFIQKKYEDRIRRMQEHVVSLNAREKQIAKEKVSLSRERLSLHNERKQIDSRQQCSLCKPQNVPSYNFDPSYMLPETFINVPVSRDYSTHANFAMNAIEQEMAHLIGRNFNLRHTTGVSSNEGRYDERGAGEEHYPGSQSMQVESGGFKDFMDPKFMMLRLDVQQVLSNLEQNKKDDDENVEPESEKE